MAALDLRGFTTPPDDFSGLHQMADTVRRNQVYEYQKQQDVEQKKMASGKFLSNYLDPKEHLTGTVYDPEIVNGFQSLLQQGADLVNQGADTNTLMMALAPQVNKLSEYSQKAKRITEQKKQTLDMVKGQKGIDMMKFSQAFDNAAFYDVDEKGNRKLKDISTIDPDVAYGDQVLRNGDVFNNEGISDFVKNSGKEKTVSDLRTYDTKGNLRHTKGEFTAPGYMVSDKDARGAHIGFVPDYEIATDEGNPIMHDFQTENGKTNAPVRMVKDYVFQALPPAAKGYILQEVKQYAKQHNQELTGKQAETLAKAFAYDELKNSSKLSSSVSELVENKPSSQQIRINLTGSAYASRGGGSSSSDVTINDVMGRIKTKVDAGTKEINKLDSDEQSALINIARGLTGIPETGARHFYIDKDANGKYGLYLNNTGMKELHIPDPFLGNLSEIGVNIKAQPGVQEKRAVIKGDKKATTTSNSDWKSRAKKVN